MRTNPFWTHNAERNGNVRPFPIGFSPELKIYTPWADNHWGQETSGESTVSQDRLKKFSVGDELSTSWFRPYDAAREDSAAATPGENHVAALQNMIYARFASNSEDVSPELLDDGAKLETTILLVSRVAGIVAMIAALAAVAVFIF